MANKNFPSDQLVFGVLLAFGFWFVVKFFRADLNDFHQMKYDWDQAQKLSEYPVIVDSVSYDFIRIKHPGQLIPNYQKTYKITQNSYSRFFRFAYALTSEKQIDFQGVVWINGLPDTQKLQGRSVLEAYDIALKPCIGKTIVTIGGHALIDNEAKYLRFSLAQKAQLCFRGSLTDVYNYSYLSGDNYSLDRATHWLSEVPKADYYLLFFDIDPKLPHLIPDEEALKYIIKNLQEQSSQKILFILPWLPKQNILAWKSVLNKYENHNFIVIDLNSLFGADRAIWLLPGTNQLNKEGYIRLSDEIIKKL